MIRSLLMPLAGFFLTAVTLYGQAGPLTTAEACNYTATSRYDDVRSFIDQLKALSPDITEETIGVSAEGREIPLLIIGNPVPRSPGELGNDQRVVVYIQANIHAGEVEGKEASLMFAREILTEKNSPLLKNVIILLCPVFNPDGNEKISRLNRTDQNGPADGVGVRYNGLSLDLNRDAMKAESPEVRGLLSRVFNRWDPQVFMDCHTTNGSFHVEPVTFTWMVNPNGDHSLISYLRDRMMPAISETLLKKYKVENCFYGEFDDMLKPEKGWFMEASEPRYMVNYYGLRNRLGILNENYIYADFKSRVLGCLGLMRSLAGFASEHSAEIRELVFSADRRTIARAAGQPVADSFAIEFSARPAEKKVTIKTYEAEFDSEIEGWKQYKKTDRQVNVTVPYFIDYYPDRSVRLPWAYMLTVNSPEAMDLLSLHGIVAEKLTEPVRLDAAIFRISDLHPSSRLVQGHYMNSIKGNYVNSPTDFPAGTIVIRMSQPLANLAAYLLEPESGDGLLAWNFLDRYLVPQWGRSYNPYPVYRIMTPVQLKTEPVTAAGN